MKLSDLKDLITRLGSVEGVERDLLKRKQVGTLGWVGAIAGALVQALIIVTDKEISLGVIGDFFKGILRGDLSVLLSSEFLGMTFLVAGFLVFVVTRQTAFMLKESEEPFRYTFWIDEFAEVKGTPDKRFTLAMSDRINLLHHDLRERLNSRIRRFSLLDPKTLSEAARSALTSHIHIQGHYAVREGGKGEWQLHLMPSIRIGPEGSAETLAVPVRYPLVTFPKAGGAEAGSFELDAERYNQMVEQVYSTVATEVYRQIEQDVKNKMNLFPTHYLRSVAYFHEAEDYARSNTIDAYDRAIDLFRESLRYFRVATIKPLSRFLLTRPFLWRLEVKYQHTYAAIQLAYAKCLFYRREISALSGRYRNPLFTVRHDIAEILGILEVLHNRISPLWLVGSPKGAGSQPLQGTRYRMALLMSLLTFERDSWRKVFSLRPWQALFTRQRRLFFDAQVVAALVHHHLGSVERAKEHLEDARAVAPSMSETNALFLFASGVIEPNVDRALPYLRQATEAAPDFQIAQYRLAYFSEVRFRMQDEMDHGKARRVIAEYEQVLRINPGNVAAVASKGYLWWLLGDRDEAKSAFEGGREIKAVARQTYIGELIYGLARISAEKGDLTAAHDLFAEALAADPGVGAYTRTAGSFTTASYFEYIGDAMLGRYEAFREEVERIIDNPVEEDLTTITVLGPCEEKRRVSRTTAARVRAFVLNDYGNACLNYHLRFGDLPTLDKAVEAYVAAKSYDDQSVVISYNLHHAYLWRGGPEDKEKAIEPLEHLKRSISLGQIWPAAVVTAARSLLRLRRDGMKEIFQKMKEETEALEPLLRRIRERATHERARMTETAQTASTAMASQTGIATGRRVDTAVSSDAEMQAIEKLRSRFAEAKLQSSGYVSEVLPETRTIMERTKLSSLFEGFSFDIDGRGVDDLIQQDIDLERFDENDVEALIVWAEILSNNHRGGDKAAQAASRRLCEYVSTRFYPENFDIALILRDMYEFRNIISSIESMLERGGGEAGETEVNRELERCAETVRPVIRNWLEADNSHYGSLTWATDFLEPAEIRVLFDRAFRRGRAHGANHTILGNYYFRNKAYRESLELYLSAVKAAPEVALYRSNLGGAYRALREWDLAQAACKEAVRLEPGNGVYWNLLGNAYFEGGRYQESVEAYRESMRLAPQAAVHHANLGGAYRALEQRNLAEQSYREAVRLETGNAEYWNLLGNLYFEGGQYQESVGPYERAVELARGVAVYHSNLGGAHRAMKELEQAEEEYRKAVELEPDNADYQGFLGNVYYERGKVEEALESFSAAVAVGGAAVLSDLNRMETVFLMALERAPGDAGAHRVMGEIMTRKGRYDRAEREYRAAISTEPDKAGHHADLGLLFRIMKRWGEAEEAYRDATRLEPDNAQHWNMLGNIYFESGRYQESIAPYRRATELDPSTPVFHANLGGSYRALQAWKDAEGAFRAALEREPMSALYMNALGNIYLERGEGDKAIGMYTEALKIDAEATYECNLGRAHGSAGDPEQMRIHCRKAVEMKRENPADPADLEALYGFLAEAHFRAGRVEEFEEYLTASADFQDEPEKKARVYNRLGNFLAEGGDLEGSIPLYEKAMALDPRRPIFENNVGMTYGKLGRWEDGLPHHRKAVELRRQTPDDPFGFEYYYDFLVESSYRAGKREEFVEQLEGSGDLADEPEKKAMIYNRLGNLLAEGGDLDGSIACYEKAIALDGKRPIFESNLGLSYGKLERWEDSIPHHRKAVELRRQAPDDPFAFDHYYSFLAEACARVGKEKEFQEILETSGDLAGDPKKRAVLYNIVADVLLQLGRYGEALQYCEKVIGLDRTVALYHANLGLAYQSLGRWEEAERALVAALSYEVTPEYENFLGNIYLASGDPDRAAWQYVKSIQLNPEPPIFMSNLLLACEGMESGEKAAGYLREALAAIPGNAELAGALERVRSKGSP